MGRWDGGLKRDWSGFESNKVVGEYENSRKGRIPNLWLTSASGGSMHFEATVLSPVSVSTIMEHDPRVGIELMKSGWREVKIWGLKPNKVFRRYWDLMLPGDYILFFQRYKYVYLGQLIDPPKVESQALASALWSEAGIPSPWSLIIFLQGIAKLDIHFRKFNAFMGYDLRFKPEMALMLVKVKDEKVRKLIWEYGSIERAIMHLAENDWFEVEGSSRDQNNLAKELPGIKGGSSRPRSKLRRKRSEIGPEVGIEIGSESESIDITELEGSSLGKVLETKLAMAFDPDVLVEKGLHLNLAAYKIPRYIEEYLVLRECEELPPPECSKRITRLLSQFRPDPEEKDVILTNLMYQGEIVVMDIFKVSTDIRRQVHKLEIPSLNIRKAMVKPEVLIQHENLLRNGVWGIGKLVYDPDRTYGIRDSDPVTLANLVPYQLTQLDLAAFQDARSKFSDVEWMNLLVQSIGLNPKAYTTDQKILFLSRLIPLVEPNVNMMEFGPRATGKTFLYRNISPKVRVIAGGRASPAELFYNKNTKAVGLIGIMDAVVLDEVQYIKFANTEEMLGKLKDYMASGNYERGDKQVSSDCSLVFVGNVDRVPRHGQDIDAFIPPFAKDPAFVDRIHGLLPGWELPKITNSRRHLARGKGLALDYLGAILHELRRVDASQISMEFLEFGDEVNIRDQQGLIRMVSGMIKVIYPDLNAGGNVITTAIKKLIEMRGYIRQWLSWRLPHEYSPELNVKVRGP